MIAIAADKGSPGVTVTALALASVWPEPAIVVEVDPWGADLPLRVRRGGAVLTDRETVLSLATAAASIHDTHGRGQFINAELVDRYAQDLSEHVRVVPGPIGAERAAQLPNWSSLADALNASTRPVVADLGRLHTASPSMPVVTAADTLVVVCRGEVESVLRLRERLNVLAPALAQARDMAPRIVVVVISRRRYGPGDAADVMASLTETPVAPFVAGVGWLAWDESAVARLLRGENPRDRSLSRTALLKSAKDCLQLIAPEAKRPEGADTPERSDTAEAALEGFRWTDAVGGELR